MSEIATPPIPPAQPPPAASPPPARQRRVSVQSLSEEFGSQRFNVKRWLIAHGHDPLNLKEELRPEYGRIIREHQKNSTAPNSPNRAPQRNKEGLTWLEATQKQDAIRKERENMIAQKVLSEAWMSTSAHHEILASLCAELELIPDKLKSELGLTVAQRDRAQKIIDEARFNAAAKTKKAFLEAKKRVREEAETKG